MINRPFLRRYTHKRGATFDVATVILPWRDEEEAPNLSGWSGSASIRVATIGKKICDLEFAWLDASQGLCRLTFDNTSQWPIGAAELDIFLTTTVGDVVAVKTIFLDILR